MKRIMILILCLLLTAVIFTACAARKEENTSTGESGHIPDAPIHTQHPDATTEGPYAPEIGE